MSSHEWREVYQTIRKVGRTIPRTMRKCQYKDTLIVAMFFGSALHDRPLCWAAVRENYHAPFRPRRLPSRSQFCRRLKTPWCEAIIRAVERRLAESDDGPDICVMDGRPLPVGPCTQDRDAHAGRIPHGFARGYRLHAVAKKQGNILAWRVTPLNVSESVVAFDLIEEGTPKGIVLADGNYDTGKLYDHTLSHGALLFTPLPHNAGCGHHPQSRTRLLVAQLWKRGGELLYNERTPIERIFSQQSSFGGGLAPLPPWVRTLPRVTRWVCAKLAIYHARLRLRNMAA